MDDRIIAFACDWEDTLDGPASHEQLETIATKHGLDGHSLDAVMALRAKSTFRVTEHTQKNGPSLWSIEPRTRRIRIDALALERITQRAEELGVSPETLIATWGRALAHARTRTRQD